MLDTKKAPGTDANAERQQDDPQRREDEQPGEPEGTPADDDAAEGKPAAAPKQPAGGKPDAAANGKTPAPEAEDTTDWKAKYEDAETKRRDTQSKLDKRSNADKESEQQLATLDRGWRGWIERNAPDAYAKLTTYEQSQGKAHDAERSVKTASDAVILGVYREGDKPFGDYLTDLAEGGARITPQSLERHRATFDKYAGNGNGNGEKAPAARPAAAAPPGPPRVAGGGRPTVEAAPAWKPGDGFNSRKFLTEGLAKGDARGKTSQRTAQSR